MFRCHGRRLTLNIVFLSLLVFHGNATLKEYVAVTALSPERLFNLLVVSVGRSWALNFAPSTKTSFSCQCQWLYQSVRANCNHKESEWQTLLGDNDRLRNPYLKHCATHSCITFIPVFPTELVQRKRQRIRTTYNFSGTQPYTLNSLLLPFQRKEGTRRCIASPLWISPGCCHFISYI